jgi:Raf kinase inhibitor-like YbhB/YbcL family protein
MDARQPPQPARRNRRLSAGIRRVKTLTIGALAAVAGLLATGALALETNRVSMQLTSTAFKEGEPIPARHTCDGKDISPPLKWSGTPPGTASFTLIADDPDAPVGTWVHWIVYDLPATSTELAEDAPRSQYLTGNARQGLNDFRRLGYGGPCPPAGKPHRYFFKLYALDKSLELPPGATKRDVERAMQGHILGEAHLVGTYQRK